VKRSVEAAGVAIAVIYAIGCGDGAPAREPDMGSCGRGLVWEGRLYKSAGDLRDVARDDDLGEADDGCNPGQRIAIEGLVGIAPQVAIGETRPPRHVFLAAGYLAEHHTHPLHDVLYPGGRGVVPRPLRCSRRFRLQGRISPQPAYPSDLVVRVSADRSIQVRLRPRARMHGLLKDGVAFIEENRRVQVAGRRCRGPHGTKNLVVSMMRAL